LGIGLFLGFNQLVRLVEAGVFYVVFSQGDAGNAKQGNLHPPCLDARGRGVKGGRVPRLAVPNLPSSRLGSLAVQSLGLSLLFGCPPPQRLVSATACPFAFFPVRWPSCAWLPRSERQPRRAVFG